MLDYILGLEPSIQGIMTASLTSSSTRKSGFSSYTSPRKPSKEDFIFSLSLQFLALFQEKKMNLEAQKVETQEHNVTHLTLGEHSFYIFINPFHILIDY